MRYRKNKTINGFSTENYSGNDKSRSMNTIGHILLNSVILDLNLFLIFVIFILHQ